MALIVWRDWAKDATLTDASAGTNVMNTISSGNVQTRQLGDVARWQFGSESPDTQSIILQFDFGATKNVNFVAVMGHNLAAANTVSLDLSDVSVTGNEVLNDSAQAVWTAGDNDGSYWFYPLGQTYSAQYAEITIAAFSNEVLDIGRVWIGESWDANVSMDFSMSIMDRGTKSKARGGSTWASTRQKLRQIQCRCFGLSDANFFGTSADFTSFLEMDQAVGTTGEIIVIPRNDNEHERHRLGVYGTMASNGPIRVANRTNGGLFTEKTFTVEEDR
jgi:hypothetical protein